MLLNYATEAGEKVQSNCFAARASGVTEFVLPKGNELSMVLPSLSFLTNQISDRWLTWITDDISMVREQLRFYGVNLKRIRIIKPRSQEHAFWLFWDALATGTSHTVVSALDYTSEKQIKLLDRAATKGKCVGLVLRERQAQAH